MLQSTALLFAFALTQPPGSPQDLDDSRARMQERANTPAQAPAPSFSGVAPGSRLFRFVGGDNAECVRSIPDVNGDGRDEVVVGIGQSGTDNLFCFDGASTTTATVLWSVQTDGGVSGGSCYGDQSIVPVSDRDGDEVANLLVGTAWGGRTAHDLDTLLGAERARFDTYIQNPSGWIYSLCEVADTTGDGVPEFAFGAGSDSDSVFLIDGASAGPQGTVLWRYAAGDAVYSVRNLGDVDGDGSDDVLAAVGDNVDRIVCLDGASPNPSGEVIWSYDPGASVYACGVHQDVTGDGIDEALAVLWTSAGSAIRCIDGAQGSLLWASTAVASFGVQAQPLPDVNGDGTDEVIVSSWENAVTVLDGSDGSLLWKTPVGTLNGGDVWTARAIGDLDGDGNHDVIAGSFDYHVYALDGTTGEIFWAFSTQNRVFSVHPVGDLNGDGRPEVVAGTQDTNNLVVVHVLDGAAGIAPTLRFLGDGSLGSPYSVELTGPVGAAAFPFLGDGAASLAVPGIAGTLGVAPPLTFLPSGVVPPTGPYVQSGTLPTNPALAGMSRLLQGVAFTFPPIAGEFTENVETVTLH